MFSQSHIVIHLVIDIDGSLIMLGHCMQGESLLASPNCMEPSKDMPIKSHKSLRAY